MKTIVIDALQCAANDDIYPELARLMKKSHAEAWAELDAEDTLLDSLSMDSDTRRKLEDWKCDVFASGTERGFRDGFRLAARLMMECFGTPDKQAAITATSLFQGPALPGT